jgi:hypothetical protein
MVPKRGEKAVEKETIKERGRGRIRKPRLALESPELGGSNESSLKLFCQSVQEEMVTNRKK